ncbi:MAG: hypothetical protein IPG35_14510 [Flavobacteriales bacterium]|nr:hypothetical protein [Flavobacteriales bacterium]
MDGAWRSAANLMVDSLRRQGVLPLTEPYSAAGHLLTGATTTTAQVLAVTGANAITDWVLVELRSATTPAQVLEAGAALVQRDGDVVAVDGTSPLGFCLAAGSYHVAVRHRNHLGVMTAQPIGPERYGHGVGPERSHHGHLGRQRSARAPTAAPCCGRAMWWAMHR